MFGTVGVLTLPSGNALYTMERPWLNNQPHVSCVPTGRYLLELVPSPLVTRITKGKHKFAFRLINVSGRSHILIHPANKALELQGCIAPGRDYGLIGTTMAVKYSQQAFDILMTVLVAESQPIELVIENLNPR